VDFIQRTSDPDSCVARKLSSHFNISIEVLSIMKGQATEVLKNEDICKTKQVQKNLKNLGNILEGMTYYSIDRTYCHNLSNSLGVGTYSSIR